MQSKKPKLCELVGVKPYQRFRFDYPERKYEDCWIDENGVLWSGDGQTHKVGKNGIYYLIENPTVKILPEKFRLTNDEYTILYVFKANRFVYDDSYVTLYNARGKRCAVVNKTFFPSVPNGTAYDTIEADICYRENGCADAITKDERTVSFEF